MDTVQPILKRGRDVWDRINMPEKEFRQRVQRVQETMDREGMDVLIAYGAGLNAYGNACYLSNYATRMPMGALVFVPKTGDVTFVFQGGSRELKAAQKTTWVEDTRSAMSLPQACIEYLNERNLMGSKVGIAGLREWMPCREFQAFVDGTGTCDLIGANHILMEMRAVKSPREWDQMRRAARIVALGFRFIEEGFFQNANEKLIDAMIDREMRLEGIEDVRLLFGKPLETSWAMRPSEDLVPKGGDHYIVYLAVSRSPPRIRSHRFTIKSFRA
jgi:Xaa-Pro aminopeptidase